jgi:phosphoribosylanthranilate isomerase
VKGGDDISRAVLGREHLVKIDGFREPEHAAAAAAAGADLIGFIFAPARRQVTPDIAAACIAAARAADPGRRFAAVGVFVDASAEEIRRVVAESGVDLVQLHGSEPPGLSAEIPVPAIKVFRPQSGVDAAAILREIGRFALAPRPPAAYVIDGYAPDASGGTGVRADWDVAAEVAAERPILLGGGLDPDNVADAIRRVRPRGVDVSSGVETAGVKDPARIEAFILAARSAFLELGASGQ